MNKDSKLVHSIFKSFVYQMKLKYIYAQFKT